MPQTIDYKVNVDLNEAMSTLQMVDMQMSQLGGMRGGGGGGYNPAPYYPTNTERAFGDLSFSAGQFVQRFQQPLGTIRTHTPEGISSMPNINFATAATAVWSGGGLGVPHGIARYDFERYAKEQFSIQGSRALAGGALGAATGGLEVAAGLAGAKAGAAIGTLLGGPGVGSGVGMLVGGFAGFMGVDYAMSPVKGMLQDRALLEDVVRSSSKLGRTKSTMVAGDLTRMHLSDPMLSASDTTMIAGLGAQFGLMGDPASSSKEYLDNFRKLSKDAKAVATALGTSLQEGMATMAQLKGVGFGVGQLGGVVDQLSGMAGGDPGKIRGLIGTGMMGASAFHGTGMARTGGFWQAIGTAGSVGAAKGTGDVSGEMWTQAGGKSGVTRLMLGSNLQFQESGMGVAMQAGLWQGGTTMGAMGGGSVMDLMAGGLGNMSSGDWMSFNRNRAAGVGNMPESQRRMMEAKAQLEMAGLWQETFGGTIGENLFAMAQGRGMSTPQAQTWASSIQQTARGGGGGPSARSKLRSRLVGAANARNEAGGVDAMLGNWRDKIGRAYNTAWVEPVSAIQGEIGDAIMGYVDHSGPAVGDVDLVLASVDGNLKAVAENMSGMDVSEYAWAPQMASLVDGKLGVTQFHAPGKGLIRFPKDVFYKATDIIGSMDQVKDAVAAGWGTGYEEVRNGRGDASRLYEDMRSSFGDSAAGRAQIRQAYKQHGITGAFAALGVDMGSENSTVLAAQIGAARTYMHDLEGVDAKAGDVTIAQHQMLSVAVGEGKRATGRELQAAMGFGPRTYGERFDAYHAKTMAAKDGADGIAGTADDSLGGTLEYMVTAPTFLPTKWGAAAFNAVIGKNRDDPGAARAAGAQLAAVGGFGVGAFAEVGRRVTGGLGLVGAGAIMAVGAGWTSRGEDKEMAAAYEKYKLVATEYLRDAGIVTQDERDKALLQLMLPSGKGVSGVSDLSDAAFEISRKGALRSLQEKTKGDTGADPMLERFSEQSSTELKKTIGKITEIYERGGGDGQPVAAKKKGKTIVPIAMGIDATDRDLYNAVSSLYRSVDALNKKINAAPAGKASVGDWDVVEE